MLGNFGIAEATFILIILGIGIIPLIFFLITLQKALERCSLESRTTTPGSVWLMLIPLFNIVWQFILVIRISESLHNEFTKREIPGDLNPGKSVGLTFCILNVCSVIPIIGIIAGVGAFVTWIMYWFRINWYSNRLEQPVTA